MWVLPQVSQPIANPHINLHPVNSGGEKGNLRYSRVLESLAMSFKIEHGLFSLDFTDYHAILGIPVSANPQDLRKHYLNLVRRLHPDSRAGDSERDRQLSADYLSKLVNPAYEKLSNDKEFTEYQILLKLKGQQASKQQDTIQLVSAIARNLAAASNVDAYYHNAVRELTAQQYDQLDHSLAIIGQLSELNLVFLMKKHGMATGHTVGYVGKPPAMDNVPGADAAPAQITLSTDSLVDACLRRAQDFEKKRDYPNAILELREATRIDCDNSVAHSRLGMIYLTTNQPTMAKIHFKKALDLNPQNTMALEGMKKLEPPAPKVATSGKSSGKVDSKGGKPEQKGGIFGLFGKKK
jgi:tetratricopeptide (TPR) repeat protein